MKSLTNLAFLMAALLSFLLCWAPAAQAHGDEPRQMIDPGQLAPGAAPEIRGVDFEFEREVNMTFGMLPV